MGVRLRKRVGDGVAVQRLQTLREHVGVAALEENGDGFEKKLVKGDGGSEFGWWIEEVREERRERATGPKAPVDSRTKGRKSAPSD